MDPAPEVRFMMRAVWGERLRRGEKWCTVMAGPTVLVVKDEMSCWDNVWPSAISTPVEE
jgi:hypothetical protein